MGAVEKAVDAAANFIGPFLNNGSGRYDNLASVERDGLDAEQLVEQALYHLETINTADRTKDLNAPYDGSLVGVAYGLLDLITSLGVLPFLSPGVVFAQRPRSVLVASIPSSSLSNVNLLPRVFQALYPILEQNGDGVQPLLNQRILPDLISAAAELALSPRMSAGSQNTFRAYLDNILSSIATSRLLPVLTSFLQQDVPSWLRQPLSKELAMAPLRVHGVRHTIEFLSLSYLSQNAHVPQEISHNNSQVPIPLEAITQASRLLAAVPSGMRADDWFSKLAPQLWHLLDGLEGLELSVAAGQIISTGILNRKSTGAQGMIGWELFAKPVLQAINPSESASTTTRQSTSDQVIVDEREYKLSLKRLYALVSSCSQSGVLRRLVGPVILSLWGSLIHASARTSLEAHWKELPRSILVRYIAITCDPKQVNNIATNLFWDGSLSWTYGAGARGGVEIRRRHHTPDESSGMDNLLSRVESLDGRVRLLTALLTEADIDDKTAGAIFTLTTRRWLFAGNADDSIKRPIIEDDSDPLDALINAKLSEALAAEFKEKFARSPQHIIELVSQILQNFINEHKIKIKKAMAAKKPSRTQLGHLAKGEPHVRGMNTDGDFEDLLSFALSLLSTITASADYRPNTSSTSILTSILPSLDYLCCVHRESPIPDHIINAATNIKVVLRSTTSTSQSQQDPQAQHRIDLKAILAELTASEPPNRTWALSSLRKLIKDPTAFSLIDVPSTTYTLLSASIADPESYVHLAAIPVLVDLAVSAPNPTLRILVDAFVDIDERSIRLKKEQDIEQALDFRLRVGEVLNNIVIEDDFWNRHASLAHRYSSLKMLVEATLTLASRRGKRHETLSKRNEVAELERIEQQEGVQAWGGPIPNLLDPEDRSPAHQQEHDELSKIVQGWQDTGIEEDVRIRSSALSVFSTIVETRLELLSQITIDAGLQMIFQILVIETGGSKAILRRAAVLVIMDLLRGMDALLDIGKESQAGLGVKQAEEAKRTISWVRDVDGDQIVKGHAESVLEALETFQLKKLYNVREGELQLSTNIGLEGNVRGLNVSLPAVAKERGRRALVVEEIE